MYHVRVVAEVDAGRGQRGIRFTEPCQAASSAACPGGGLAGLGPVLAGRVGGVADQQVGAAVPGGDSTDWWPEVCPGVAMTDRPGRISASPSSSSKVAFWKSNQS